MKISQAFTFEAAHRLPKVPATHRCSRLHGHSYRVEAQLEGPIDPATGFVVDFFDLETAFKDVIDTLDHRYLNEIEGLENPTAEHIAIWVWRKMKARIGVISSIRIYETPDCWAEYDGT